MNTGAVRLTSEAKIEDELNKSATLAVKHCTPRSHLSLQLFGYNNCMERARPS